MIEKPFLLSTERIERLEQLNSGNEQVLELLGFVKSCEEEIRRLQRVTKGVGLMAQGNSDLISKNHSLHYKVEELQKALDWYASDEFARVVKNYYFGATTMGDIGNPARQALERTKP